MEKAKQLFSNKNFKNFFVGSVVSQIGSTFIQFAASLFILDLTGQAIYMSIFFAMSSILNIVLQPFFGALSDRLDKVKVLYMIDYLSGFTDLALAVLLFTTDNVTILLIGLFANGIVNAIMSAMYQPVYSSMIPMLIRDEELNQAYSFTATLGNFQHILGVLLASILYAAIGYRWLLVINGLSFIFAAILEMRIKVEHVIKSESEGFKALLDDIKLGYKYMTDKRELINMAKVAVTMNFFLVGIFGITLSFMIYQTLGLEPYVLAMLNIGISIGGILMALRVANANVNNAGDRIFYGFLWAFISLLAITGSFYLVDQGLISMRGFILVMVLIFLSFGASGSYIQIPLNTAYAKRVDKDMMGRVMALRQTLSAIASPLSMVIFGIILDYGNVYVALILGSLGIGASTLYSLLNPHIRGLNDK